MVEQVIAVLVEEQKSQGISDAELSRRSGLRQSTLREVLQGVAPDPRLRTIAAIAHGLGRPLSRLIREAEKIPEKITE